MTGEGSYKEGERGRCADARRSGDGSKLGAAACAGVGAASTSGWSAVGTLRCIAADGTLLLEPPGTNGPPTGGAPAASRRCMIALRSCRIWLCSLAIMHTVS